MPIFPSGVTQNVAFWVTIQGKIQLMYLCSATIGSDVPNASSHPLPRIEEVSFLLSAVNEYRRPLSSISLTASGNSSNILSVTLKLGTNGVSPPSGGGTSQKSITFVGKSLI